MTRVLPLACALLFSACRLQAPEPEAYFFAHRVSESDTELDEIRFRSFRKDGRLASSVTLGKPGGITESRYSLVPPLPSRLSYEVSIPEAARLEFEIGVVGLGEAVLPAPVVFTIDVDGEPLFQETVRRRFGNQWFEKSVDLARWSGRNVTVAFETKFEQTPFIAPDTPQVLAAWGNPVLGGRHAGEPRPDLILVSIDCLRADHVSAYGHHRPTTPSLDALANDGVLFENAVSVSTWTLPTHMSMLTGLMPAQHGLSRAQKRSRTAPYLPEILSRAGYETMGIVSGLYLSPTFGYEEGFDSYRALIDEPAEKLVDAALDRLLAEPRRPRFLFLHFFDAHWPYLPRKEYLEQVGERPRDISKLLDMV